MPTLLCSGGVIIITKGKKWFCFIRCSVTTPTLLIGSGNNTICALVESDLRILVLHTVSYGEHNSLTKNLNASRLSEHPQSGGEMSKRFGGIIDCKDKKTSS